MTLGQKLKQLRQDREMSLLDVGKRCGLQRTTIWKLEHNYAVRGSTLKKICFEGLRLREGSKDWEEIQALWTSNRTGKEISPQILAGGMTKFFHKGNAEMEYFLKIISKLSEKDFYEITKAIERPSILAAIHELNKIYEGKK